MINLIYTILCISCLCIGFFAGRKDIKNNDVDFKISNPVKHIKEKIESEKYDKEVQEQLDELNKIAENIENYDGTPRNQKELKNIEIGLL